MMRDDIPVAELYQPGLSPYHIPSDLPTSQFTIVGGDYSQVVEINLAPGQVISFEPGSMLHMSSDIVPRADVGTCSQGFLRCCCLGESFFRLNLVNSARENRSVALTPSFPARIVPIDMLQYPQGLFIKDRTFLGAFGTNWSVAISMVNNIGAGLFAGQGFFLNRIMSDGWVFLAAGGTILEKHLQQGEVMLVDHTAVVAFEPTVSYGVEQVQGFLTCCCGGMGLFNTRLQGPGLVLLQSMPVSKLKKSLGVNRGSNNNNNNNNSNNRNNNNSQFA